ncbi:SAGA-type complex-like protein [Elsinoe australis]|uniref:SAGA-type complex-like protein n=1 Tax=Elsinoe australis TaxID=40998 RepID=A0A4U7AYA6_9PEZI|nr:SAGA-type complex-like protein [Elsinoe australis]
MNPADLTLPALDSTPPLSAKTLPGSATLAGKNAKLPLSAPRIDTEPIYTQLKAAIGDNWSDYKNALSSFLLGKLNQTELTHILLPILTPPVPTPSPSPRHLHNTLLTALYANALYRDPPPPDTTAPFVLATDAPTTSTSTSKPSTGTSDAISDRNKREVMALTARDRRRIKSVRDPESAAALDAGPRQARTYREALDALPSSVVYGLGQSGAGTGTAGGGGGGGGGKTNTDLEIRRRFALPLASETQEFPARENIQARIEPIAYEEGLSGAMLPAQVSAAGELVETAVEMYVKEVVGGWLAMVRGEGEGMVQSRRYRKRVRREERAEDEGAVGVVRDVLGRLPVEVEAVEKREAVGRGDLRVVWRLEGGTCREDRFLGERWREEEMEEGDLGVGMLRIGKKEGLVNGVNGVNGVGGSRRQSRVEEEDGDWGWAGGGVGDRGQLMDVLNGALAVGS